MKSHLPQNGLSLQARFSALLFLFQGDYRDIYLHCSLNLCDQRNSSCSAVSPPTLLPGLSGLSGLSDSLVSPQRSRRFVRSVDKVVPLQPVSVGPITCEYKPQP